MTSSQDQCVKNGLTIVMKHIRQHVDQRKVAWANSVDHCNDHKICGELPINETVENHVISTCLSVDCFELNTDPMSNKLLHTESAARYIICR
jgi:hypothetical protein